MQGDGANIESPRAAIHQAHSEQQVCQRLHIRRRRAVRNNGDERLGLEAPCARQLQCVVANEFVKINTDTEGIQNASKPLHALAPSHALLQAFRVEDSGIRVQGYGMRIEPSNSSSRIVPGVTIRLRARITTFCVAFRPPLSPDSAALAFLMSLTFFISDALSISSTIPTCVHVHILLHTVPLNLLACPRPHILEAPPFPLSRLRQKKSP
jgi:hypothetical protein